MEANFVCGEVKVRPPRSAGVDEIAGVAEEIARAVRAAGVRPTEADRADALLERLRAQHADFHASFPFVLRWIVQTGQYSARAMRRFLLWYAKQPFGESPEAFLRAQAEYAVFVLRTEKHPAKAEVAQYRKGLVEALLKEHRDFAAAAAAADRKARESERGRSLQNRERLLELCARLKATDGAGPPGGASGGA